MANLNKVMLMGHMTRDPQLSYLPNQTPVVEFGMAVNEKRKDTEKTHFFDLSMFGKRAEVLQKYIHKGDPLFIEGKLDYQQWEKDGQKRNKIKVIVTDFQFLGKGNRQNQTQEPESQGEAPYGENQDPYGGIDDDIPF